MTRFIRKMVRGWLSLKNNLVNKHEFKNKAHFLASWFGLVVTCPEVASNNAIVNVSPSKYFNIFDLSIIKATDKCNMCDYAYIVHLRSRINQLSSHAGCGLRKVATIWRALFQRISQPLHKHWHV